MKKTILVFISFFLLQNILYSQERQKLAQTGLKFLSVSTDARLSGLGEAATSLSDASSSALFYNPSAMAGMQDFTNLSFSSISWIADIKYLAGSVAFRPFDGSFGVIGVSLVSVDYGEFNSTIYAPTEEGFIDIGTYKPTAMAVGVGYAKELSQKFAVGGNVKYVRQSLGTHVVNVTNDGAMDSEKNEIDALAFDFGILYHTGFKSLNFGMSVRNFSTELRYKQEGFQLPLTFKIGFSMNAMDVFEVDRDMHSMLVSVDASHPRDYPEQIFIGGEYVFMKTFSLRAGYSFPSDEQEFSAGLGVKQRMFGYLLGVDYGYTEFGIFTDVHRITLNFAF